MYKVYAILRINDSSHQSEPYVSVEVASNYEEELIDKLRDLYNEYLEMVASWYSEEDKQTEWYQNMLKQIEWDTDRKGFTDSSGYKEYVRYVIKELA